MKFCQKCGTQNEDAAAFCNNCGEAFQAPQQTQVIQAVQETPEKPKKKKKKGRKVLILLVVVIVAFFAIMMSGGDDGTATLVTNANGDVVLDGQVISQDDFKKSCNKVTYEELARNPENFKGQNLTFTGEVIQCEQSYGTSYFARVNVTVDEYGYYDDTIYVTFEIPEGNDKILEEDIVKLYGVCQGSESYTSIFGEQITIPSLDAVYVEIVK